MTVTQAWSRRAVLNALEGVQGGRVTVRDDGHRHAFGRATDLDTVLEVRDPRFYRRALTGDDIGIGESYMDGDWGTPDLVSLARLMLRNQDVLGWSGRLAGLVTRLAGGVARRLRDNSLVGSRRHVRHHYDLGNGFFRLFLDQDLVMYSSAYFQNACDSLETAQANKVDRICRLLSLGPGDRVLEIGSGWGGFARYAAGRYGCHVTTTTISEAQYGHLLAWKRDAGRDGERVDVLKADYRELSGRFDRIVSIEMFEAVGLRHYADYFGAVDRLLTPDGAMLLQTITMDDQRFPRYHGTPDWIEKHIFPGGELASVGEILKAVSRGTTLSLYGAEHFGAHYARTLQAWRSRFHARLDSVRALGFDDRFIRMWDFYLAICEATFLERHTGVVQMLLVKNASRRRLFNEPWGVATADPVAADRPACPAA